MELVVTPKPELEQLLTATVERLLDEKLARIRFENVPKEWLTNGEAMDFLHLSRATLQRYRNDGRLPYSKIGSNIFYRYEDVVAFLEKGTTSNTEEGID